MTIPEEAGTTAPAPDAPGAPGALTGHLIGYAELATALLRAWERTMVHRLTGAVLLTCGLSSCLLILTVGAIAAAWSTSYRWVVLLGFAGLFLAAALLGLWLLRRRAAVPAPASVLLEQLRQDALLVSEAWRRRWS
jgi:hypothetical protein